MGIGGALGVALATSWGTGCRRTLPTAPGAAPPAVHAEARPLLSEDFLVTVPGVGRWPAPTRGPLGYEMSWLPAGAFWMGSPRDEEGRHGGERRHEVRLTAPIWVGRTEVTQALWERVMGDDPSADAHRGVPLRGPDLPVHTIRWFDAIAFANRMSRLEGLAPAYTVTGTDVHWDVEADGYRLLTEAEWEFAARGGRYAPFGVTGEREAVCAHANVANPSGAIALGWTDPVFPCEDGVLGLAPVATFQAGPWGLFDMVGNVWEWVWDWEGPYPERPVTDPRGPPTGTARIKRGGSWMHRWKSARAADRSRDDPAGRYPYVGVRLARWAR